MTSRAAFASPVHVATTRAGAGTSCLCNHPPLARRQAALRACLPPNGAPNGVPNGTADQAIEDVLSYPPSALEWRPCTTPTPNTESSRVPNSFVDTFRMSSPYIHAYHGLTFVIHIPGALLHEHLFSAVLMDIALMRAIGIKPVLVLGPAAQIDARLSNEGIESTVVNGIRVTDARTLEIIKEAAGAMRFEVEGVLARGVVNMPLSTRVSVVSGSFYSARPLGIIDGVDYGYTGVVRRIDSEGINRRLDQGDIIVLPNVGFSPSGQLFNCQSEEVAGQCAAQLKAEKLIFLSSNDAIYDLRTSRTIPNLTYEQALRFREARGDALPAEFRRVIDQSVVALRGGVRRTHILNRMVNGALLMEVFHRDGIGLMISADIYEGIRAAQVKDVMGIMEIIAPLMDMGILKIRNPATIEQEIDEYVVMERDGMIISCVSLKVMHDNPRWAEVGCFVVHDEYRKLGKGDAMMSFVERMAWKKGVDNLFILSTQSFHFFMDKGFSEIDVTALPKERRDYYDFERKPKIFLKRLAADSLTRFDDALRVQV